MSCADVRIENTKPFGDTVIAASSDAVGDYGETRPIREPRKILSPSEIRVLEFCFSFANSNRRFQLAVGRLIENRDRRAPVSRTIVSVAVVSARRETYLGFPAKQPHPSSDKFDR